MLRDTCSEILEGLDSVFSGQQTGRTSECFRSALFRSPGDAACTAAWPGPAAKRLDGWGGVVGILGGDPKGTQPFWLVRRNPFGWSGTSHFRKDLDQFRWGTPPGST